jgi:hypothetical protein
MRRQYPAFDQKNRIFNFCFISRLKRRAESFRRRAYPIATPVNRITTVPSPQIYRNPGIQCLARLAYSPVMDRYDWPLLAVTLLTALSITVALRGLRAVLGLLSSTGLRLAIWRKRRLWNKLASEGMVDAPRPLKPAFRYGKGY